MAETADRLLGFVITKEINLQGSQTREGVLAGDWRGLGREESSVYKPLLPHPPAPWGSSQTCCLQGLWCITMELARRLFYTPLEIFQFGAKIILTEMLLLAPALPCGLGPRSD